MASRRLAPTFAFPAILLVTLAAGQPAAAEEGDAPAASWKAPPYWMPTSVEAHGRQALAAGPTALPFIALPPCRLVDTRGNGAPLTGGFLPAATVRNYTLAGVCGVPANAQAISLNATAVKPIGPGFLVLYPEGGTFPPVSTLNYLGNDVIVNAAVVPLSGTGGISVALGVSGGDVLLDTNGYYAPQDVVGSPLPAGKTIRGAYNIGGTAAAAGSLANTSISFIFSFATLPTVTLVLQGTMAPPECPGSATSPQALPGFVCIYEEQRSNSNGVLLNGVQLSGATIFTFSAAAGGFFTFGAWAATGN